MKNQLGMTIGQVAKGAGVGIETIRFYEREGVIDKPHRRESGYRDFPSDTITRIKFIKVAQQLGFSLKEISELLALSANPKEKCSAVKRKAETKLTQIKQKIADLKRMQRVLSHVTEACDSNRPITECPILRCFSEK
jgi:MerR family transcriptional regulator, copper efflux regulator